MSFSHFTFTADYKNEFKDYVTSLYKSEITEVDNKKAIIESLTESYFLHSGEVPDSVQLDRLSTWLLKGIEHDNEEYDVKTNRQLQRVNKERESVTGGIDEVTHDKDGNRHKLAKQASDTEGSHRVSVVLDYDREKDKRKYNAPVKTSQIAP